MNYFAASYNPMNAFAQGYGLGDAMRETAARAHERQQAMAARQGLIDLGQQDQLIGFDGVEGATRPQWLKQLYAVNPEQAYQVEQHVAAPFQADRDIRKMGEVERAKRQADADIGMNMMNAFFKNRGGGPPAPTEAGTVPASATESNAFATGGPMPPPNLAGLSGDEPSFEMTPQGFKFGVKSASPLDSAIKVADVNLRQADQKLKGKEYDLKVEDQIVNKAKAADQFDTSHFNKINEVHKQEYDLKKQIDALKKDKAEGNISPQDYLASSNSILADLKALGAQKQALLTGRSTAQDTLGMAQDQYRNPSSTEPQAVVPKTGARLTQPAPVPTEEAGVSRGTIPLATSPSIGAGLPYKKQVEVQQEKIKGDLASQQKAKQEKTTAMNKMIEDAQGDHMRLRSMKDQVDRMIQLAKEGIGSKAMGQLPFGIGEAFQRAWSGRNDELQSLRGPAIQLFMSANSSKMMDTPKEVERLTGGVPDVGRDEDVNKRNAAIMGNDFYSSLQKTPAMEWWSHNKGTMDGFSQAWDDWRQHNPQYTVSVKNGQTYLDDAPYVMPPTKWMQLRKKYSPEQIKTLQERGLDYKD